MGAARVRRGDQIEDEVLPRLEGGALLCAADAEGRRRHPREPPDGRIHAQRLAEAARYHLAVTHPLRRILYMFYSLHRIRHTFYFRHRARTAAPSISGTAHELQHLLFQAPRTNCSTFTVRSILRHRVRVPISHTHTHTHLAIAELGISESEGSKMIHRSLSRVIQGS